MDDTWQKDGDVIGDKEIALRTLFPIGFKALKPVAIEDCNITLELSQESKSAVV